MALTKVTSGLISADASSVDLNIDAGTLYIDSTNNRVGVGTTSPSYPLHVYSSSGDANIEIETTQAGSSARLRLTGSSTGTSTLMFADENDTNVGLVQYDHTSNFIKFHTADSERMRIDSSGNVGINSSSPTTGRLVIPQNNSVQPAIHLPTDESTILGPSADTQIRMGGNLTLQSSNQTTIAAKNASGIIVFQTGSTPTEHMRIASNGVVGIGTSSPEQRLHVNGYQLFENTNEIRWKDSGGTQRTSLTLDSSNNLKLGTSAGANLIFMNGTGYTERMRIDSSGDVHIGASSYSTSNPSVKINKDTIGCTSSTTASQTKIEFQNPNGVVGTIITSGSATAYNTSSDYRLKENVTYDWDATTRLKQLKPARFNFISNADITFDGFLAHEVSSIVPEAIHGEKDAVDDEGNAVYQGIDQSKLVPLLVKTIQELEARISILEGN